MSERYAIEALNKQWISGEWCTGSSDEEMVDINPFTDETITTIQGASAQDVDRAYKAAERAQKKWANKSPSQRVEVLNRAVDVMHERKDEIVDWLIKESGSTRIKANIEWESAVGIIQESASFPMRMDGEIKPSPIPGKESRVYRMPVGVVGIISPWNFPFHLTMRSLAPALATGNGVVLKPASTTPVTGATLPAKIFEEAGVPADLLNVVIGSGSTIGDDIVEHEVPDVISFTGSTAVGRRVGKLAGEGIKDVSLELGGNNALLVLEDADLEQAADAAAFGSFLHQGQICIAVNRVLVADAVHDEFMELFEERVRGLATGDPANERTLVGPIIDDEQLQNIQEIVDATIEQGADVVVQGDVDGRVMEPVLFDNVTPEMDAFEKEVFGPVASVTTFEDEDEAIEMANATEYGLSGAIITQDPERGVRLAKRIKTGMVHVNDMSVNDDPNAAFGGEKASGIGRFGGRWVLEKFTTERWITVQHEQRHYPI